MEAILHIPPPLDLTRTFSRYRTWGDDPVNRLGEGVFRLKSGELLRLLSQATVH